MRENLQQGMVGNIRRDDHVRQASSQCRQVSAQPGQTVFAHNRDIVASSHSQLVQAEQGALNHRADIAPRLIFEAAAPLYL